MPADRSKSVSIVMCTYNGEQFIREQLDSIVNQTYPISELIIQDDCSTDGTVSILKEYEQRYPYIRLFVNEYQKGINENFFSAIDRAKNEYVAISDQDDIWELEKIEKQMNEIGSNWLSSGFTKPFVAGSSIQIHFDNRIPNYTLERMIYVGMTPGHTMLIHKDLITKIPNLNKWNQFFVYDHLLQIVAASYGKVQFCDVVLVNNRRHLSAATYTPPTNTKRTIGNILSSTKRTFLLYRELKPQMCQYFFKVHELLSSISPEAIQKEDATKMAYYQSKNSFLDYFMLTVLCLKTRNKVFHSVENNFVVSVLRALFFPISCSDYFRYLSKNYRV